MTLEVNSYSVRPIKKLKKVNTLVCEREKERDSEKERKRDRVSEKERERERKTEGGEVEEINRKR